MVRTKADIRCDVLRACTFESPAEAPNPHTPPPVGDLSFTSTTTTADVCQVVREEWRYGFWRSNVKVIPLARNYEIADEVRRRASDWTESATALTAAWPVTSACDGTVKIAHLAWGEGRTEPRFVKCAQRPDVTETRAVHIVRLRPALPRGRCGPLDGLGEPLLRQRHGGELLRSPGVRAARPEDVQAPHRGAAGGVRPHRGLYGARRRHSAARYLSPAAIERRGREMDAPHEFLPISSLCTLGRTTEMLSRLHKPSRRPSANRGNPSCSQSEELVSGPVE